MLPQRSLSPSWLAALLIVLSVGYALTFFTGLEWHSAYFGRAYKAIHPESFPGDPYMPSQNPISLSSFYVLGRLVGDLWLDDRLTMGVYILLVIVGLLGVDRTARALGASGWAERVVVLSLMAMPHRFKAALGEVVTFADFYAGCFAGVVAIWLFYWLFAGAKAWKIGLCIGLLWSLNPKWAWFPTIMALTLLIRERFTPRLQRVAVLLGLLGCGALYLAYDAWIRPPGGEHALLFDYLNPRGDDEANPFLDPPLAALGYFGLLGVGMWLAPPAPLQARRVRTCAVLGILLWVFGGLYATSATDPFKIPYLVPLGFNRATQWPQYVLFLSICVAALAKLRAAILLRYRAVLLVAILSLYATFTPSRFVQVGVLWGVLFVGIWAMRRVGRPRAEAWFATTTACALLLATLLVYARAVIRRRPALAHLAVHGVIGDNPSAKWAGVDAYLRSQTAPDAILLPITTRDYPWRPGLRYDTSLRTRTGRTMPLGSRWSVLFDYGKLQELKIREQRMDQLIAAWGRRDLNGVERELAFFKEEPPSPDYLVVERSEAEWLQGRSFSYHPLTTRGEFVILARAGGNEPGGAGHAERP